MHPYSSVTPSNPTSSSTVVPPDSEASCAMLLPGQPQSPSAMLYPQSSFSQKSGYLSPNNTATTNNNCGGNGSNVTSTTTNGAALDIMSHSLMQSSHPQAVNNNTGSFYCWAPPPNAAVPTATSRLPHFSQRRSGVGTSYRISPQNPPSEFSHAQYYFRQQHSQPQQQSTAHKAASETGGYGGTSAKLSSGSSTTTVSSSSNWKERPHVGKYSLIRTIGKGNFAKVKLAQHVTTGMEVSHFSSL